MMPLPARYISWIFSLILGSGFGSVYALTETDFSNTGSTLATPSQYELNTANNTDEVLVLPKGMTVTKTADASAVSSPTLAGEQIIYTIDVENIGLLELNNVQVIDSIIPASAITLVSGDVDNDQILDASEIWSYQGIYEITQSDIDNNAGGDGEIENLVTVVSDELPPLTDDAVVPIVQVSEFVIAKTVDQPSVSIPTVVNYSITIENTGNTTLTNVDVTDTLPDGSVATLSGPATDIGVTGSLDVGETWTFTTGYLVTQSDLDAQVTMINTVIATTDQTGTAPLTDTAETIVDIKPDMIVSKVVDQDTIAVPGTLNYTISVKNSGNLSLTDVVLEDVLPDGSVGTLVGPLSDTGIAAAIDVGETWTYTVAFEVTQDQIDAGLVRSNKVTVLSKETGPSAYKDTAETVINSTPSFEVAKTVDASSINAPTQLNYTVSIVNTGNVTLNNVVASDLLPDGSTGTLIGPAADAGVVGALDVGETWVYSISYQATQDDIDSQPELVNAVSVTTDETGTTTESDTAKTTISVAPDMLVAKTVDQAAINTPAVLNYDISVENTGNVSLNNISLIDTLPDTTIGSLIGPLSDVGLSGVLDVGETWSYTTTYAVTQSEIDAGLPRLNKIAVTSDETGSTEYLDSANTTITISPDFELTKTVDLPSIAVPSTLSYTIALENTGNITLTGITVTDTQPDGSVTVLTSPTGDGGVVGSLDVGETWTYTVQFNATQQDINAGVPLTNIVEAVTSESGTASASATTSVSQTPSINIVKSLAENDYLAEGDKLNYSLVVSNNGNVVLNDIAVADPIADAGSIQCSESAPISLIPGAQTVCTAVHTVTSADVAATQITNVASVTSTDPSGVVVDADSNTVVVSMDRVPPVATDNSFSSSVSAVPIVLDGATDDTDLNGDLDPSTVDFQDASAIDTDADGDRDSLTLAGVGQWSVDNVTGEVTFTPAQGYTGDPQPLNYTVSDQTGLLSNVAVLLVDYPQTAPTAKDDLVINPLVESPSNPTTIDVLADNGSGPDTDPENDLNISSISFTDAAAIDTDSDGDLDSLVVIGEGTWIIDNLTGFVTFTPEPDFLSDPTPVTYTVSDNIGLVSNEAVITVDYPQTAPVATDDQKLEQPLGQPVTLAVVANDSDPENNLDPTQVFMINPVDDSAVTSLIVEDEGTWTVDPVSGDITFTPETGFLGSPTPVEYTVADTTDLVSNRALVTVTFEEPAALIGTVWLDTDRDGIVDSDEDRKAGWILRVKDSSGALVATVTTDINGDYSVTGLIPGVYTVEFYNQNDVFMDQITTSGPVLAGQVVNLPLPVDPSGVVYDSISRLAVPGVTLYLLNESDIAVHEDCLASNQQGQTTLEDGLYAFDIFPGAHSTCPLSALYKIELAAVPSSYHQRYSVIIPPFDTNACGSATLGCAFSKTFDSSSVEANCTVDSIANTNACEIQAQPDAPELGEDTNYYLEFIIAAGDQNVIFNHIPIDAKINDAEILISKSANKRTVSAGGLVQYTLTAENTKEVPAPLVLITDKPPPGFSLVTTSVRLTRAGADGEMNTDDDFVSPLAINNTDPVAFAAIDFSAEEVVHISYVMRVGTGVIQGEHVNRANAIGPSGIASNDVSATVTVVADPVLDQATLIGKVFVDVDGDGFQDTANATGVRLKSEYYGWNSLTLPDIDGRRSVYEDPVISSVSINMPLSEGSKFAVSTVEGSRLTIDEDGTVTEAHVGDKARGLNSQDIRVCSIETTGIPTGRDGKSDNSTGVVPVLQIVLSNMGINERGIPGVRLATVTGLIIETDSYGRFSLADVDAGSNGIGQNFVLKVDPATLPEGASLTTPNPYILRIISGTLNKANFGVRLNENDAFVGNPCLVPDSVNRSSQSIEVELGSVFFNVNDHKIREDQRGIVADIIKKLKEYGGGAIVIEAHTDSDADNQYNLALSLKRAETVRAILRKALGADLMEQVSVEVGAVPSPERSNDK